MFLIDDILLAPLKGLIWLGNQIDEVVQKELHNEDRIKEELMELQIKFELGEIDEEEYNKKEKELLDVLDAIKNSEEEEV